MSAVWEKIILILLVLVSILVGMTLHELGHFLFAKLFKVNVKEFSIGIGPKIFSFRTRSGMLVSIKPFLLMAYVLIDSNKLIKVYTEIYNDSLELGYKNHYFGGYESEDNSFKYKFRRFFFLKSHDKYERLSKREEYKLLIDDCKLWQKNIIFFGGVFFNILLAVFFWLIAFFALDVKMNPFVQIGQSFEIIFKNMFFINSGAGTSFGDIIQTPSDVVKNIDFTKTFFVYMYIFNFMLFFFNLIPIPPLDGYKIAIETWQKWFNFKIDPKVENAITIIGVIIMLWIFVSSIINDFI